MYKKSKVHYIAKWVIEVMFYLGSVCTIAAPFVTDDIMRFFGYKQGGEMIYIVTLFFTGALSVYILFNMKMMYKTLMDGNPFIESNITAFRQMAVASALICIIYIIKCFFVFTIGSVVIAVIFAIACLLCLTLKDLFKQAINYKTENDLTI